MKTYAQIIFHMLPMWTLRFVFLLHHQYTHPKVVDKWNIQYTIALPIPTNTFVFQQLHINLQYWLDQWEWFQATNRIRQTWLRKRTHTQVWDNKIEVYFLWFLRWQLIISPSVIFIICLLKSLNYILQCHIYALETLTHIQ